MALSVERQLSYWGIGLCLVLLVFYYLGGTLTPFLLGAGVAYALDPVADWFEEKGMARIWAVVLIMFGAVLAFLAGILLLLPFLLEQARSLFALLPELSESFRNFLTTRLPGLENAESPIRRGMSLLQERLSGQAGTLLEQILSSTLAVFDFVMIVVVSPVVAFYLLLDWDKMMARIDGLLPRDHRETVRDLAGQINRTLAAFMRGQVAVMGFLGLFYASGLAIVGLNFGVVIGLVAGMISFIPFVGNLLGGGVALAFALFQFWGDWVSIGAVVGVFAAGQFLEGNFLTPNLVGNSVGLHPVWLMFALSAFGALFGFFGLLIAVPAAAMMGVLIRFGIQQYQQGRLYKGHAGQP